MGKLAKRKPGIFSLILTILIFVLFAVGLICLFALDANGGVGVVATSTILNNVVGVGLTFSGLTAIFGGTTNVGMYSVVNDDVSDIENTGLTADLNANIGAIIGIVVFVIGVLMLLFLRKKKMGLLLGTVITIVGSILLLCSGQFFSMANSDTVGGLTDNKYGDIFYLDLGCMIAGVFGIVIGIIGLIQTIIGFVRKFN